MSNRKTNGWNVVYTEKAVLDKRMNLDFFIEYRYETCYLKLHASIINKFSPEENASMKAGMLCIKNASTVSENV